MFIKFFFLKKTIFEFLNKDKMKLLENKTAIITGATRGIEEELRLNLQNKVPMLLLRLVLQQRQQPPWKMN